MSAEVKDRSMSFRNSLTVDTDAASKLKSLRCASESNLNTLSTRQSKDRRRRSQLRRIFRNNNEQVTFDHVQEIRITVSTIVPGVEKCNPKFYTDPDVNPFDT